jgi:glycosyltransferase involved in cell wall biosynthesis
VVRIDNNKSLSRNITLLAYQIGPYGGIERMLLQVAQALEKAGHNVQGISTACSAGRTILGGIPILSLEPRNIWLRRIYSRSLHFWIPYYLRKIATSSEIIIVGHFHLLKHASNIAEKVNQKVCLITYGTEIWREWTLVEKRLLRKCDRIIAISNYTALSIIDRLPDRAAHVVVLPNMTDINQFEPDSSPLSSHPRIILTVGRLSSTEAYKGHDLVIKSLCRVENSLQVPIEYRIVGEGDDKVRLESIAKEYGVLDKVHFLGWLKDDDLLKEYQRCHVFAMPSYVSKRPNGSWTGEGFGFVYIEAAACGKPVLACDVGGQVDCVRHGKTGILVKPTLESVGSGLIEILSDLERAHRMGMAGRQYVHENFTREHFNHKWIELIGEM